MSLAKTHQWRALAQGPKQQPNASKNGCLAANSILVKCSDERSSNFCCVRTSLGWTLLPLMLLS